MKRLISAMLILAMVFVLLPVAALPASAVTYSGKCGPNLNWELTDGVLEISGSGDMYDYNITKSPWYSYNVRSVKFGSGVTSIGTYAFVSSALESITIPDSVKKIGGGAFHSCTRLTSAIIGNGVTSIPNGAFSTCVRLGEITIPNSVTSIGSAAFHYCRVLQSISIPNSVTSIGEDAFNSCSALTSITIPNSVTSIGKDAFRDCTCLSNASIGNGVTGIAEGLFWGCTHLSSVSLPDCINYIGDYAFRDCSLRSITIPNCTKSIGNYAFRDCSLLASITFGNNVKTIGDWAFSNCIKLSDVYFTGTELDWDAIQIGWYNESLLGATIEYNWHIHNYVDGVCTICGAVEVIPGGGDYTLADSIKGGDEVVIYSPGHKMAIKDENDNNWYLVPQAITPADDKITAQDASLVWKVVDNGDGSFSFTNGSDAIVCWVSGNYFELTNDPNYDGADGKWKVTWTDGLAYIQHATFTGNYGPAYIECYYNAAKDKTNISGYSTNAPTAKSADFGWQFYVKSGSSTTPTEPTEPAGPTEPSEPFTGVPLSDIPAGGTAFIIYNAENRLAMCADTNGGKSGGISALTNEENSNLKLFPGTGVFKLTDNGDGTYYLTCGGRYLTCTSTNAFEFMNSKSEDAKWKIEKAPAGFYIKSATRVHSSGPATIEVYNSAFSPYGFDGSTNAAIFTMQFYAVNGTLSDPDGDGYMGERPVAGDKPVNGDKVVIYNDNGGMCIGPQSEDGTAFSGIPSELSGNTLDAGNGSLIFTVHVDGSWYAFENNGKYLRCSENETVDDKINNDEHLYLAALDNDYSWWRLEEVTGGYILYNKTAKYRSSSVCIEYFSNSFSGWTYNGSTILFAMRFFRVEDPDDLGYVVKPDAPPTVLSGDLNGDGDVDTVDSIRLARFLVGLAELTEEQQAAADVNGDGDVTATDAIRLARYLVGLVETLRPEPAKAAPRATTR